MRGCFQQKAAISLCVRHYHEAMSINLDELASLGELLGGPWTGIEKV